MVLFVEVRPNLLSGDSEKFLLEDISQVYEVWIQEIFFSYLGLIPLSVECVHTSFKHTLLSLNPSIAFTSLLWSFIFFFCLQKYKRHNLAISSLERGF